MNMEEAQKLYLRIEEGEDDISCVISTSQLQGEGNIIDAHAYNDVITFDVIIDGEKHEIPCFGIMIR